MTKIICLEGISGAGKTNQARKIQAYLSKKDCRYLIVNEKQYSPFKEIILDWHINGANQNFDMTNVLIFAKARAETHKKHFYPLIGRIDYLIFDRSLYTSGVYQCNDKISCNKIVEINFKEGAIKPEKGIILLCSPDLAIQRINDRRVQQNRYVLPSINESFEEILKRRKLYLELLKDHPELYYINSDRNQEEIFEELKMKLDI